MTPLRPLALLALAVAFASATSAAPGDQRAIDWIVAVVDADVVTYTEFLEELRVSAARTGRGLDALSRENKEALAGQVLEKLITDALLVQEAKRKGITVTPAEADEAASTAVERMRSQFVDQNAYERALASEFTTPDRVRARYRAQAESQIFRNKLIDREIRRQIKISDSDVLIAYDRRGIEIHVRHILVADSNTAEAVRVRLVKGDDFDAVSSSVAAIEAADLGWVKRGSLVQAFEDAAFALAPNEISRVVHTRFGYHVIQLFERRAIELPPLTDELKEEIFNDLYSSRFEEQFTKFIERIRARAYIEFREESVQSIF
ncbi:MAG: SurA N-terminal domain-containing protein [Candidatus Hydrogenedentota bacterium]